MEERWVEFGEVIRDEMCNGKEDAEGCELDMFGSLLNEEGKLGANWVRGALLSVERDPNSRVDLQEMFDLLDTKGDGKLSPEVISELINDLKVDKPVDSAAIYAEAAQV